MNKDPAHGPHLCVRDRQEDDDHEKLDWLAGVGLGMMSERVVQEEDPWLCHM